MRLKKPKSNDQFEINSKELHNLELLLTYIQISSQVLIILVFIECNIHLTHSEDDFDNRKQ